MKTIGAFAGCIGVCVFGTVLFAIAAMVVLALIPLYLETKSTSANAYQSEPFSMSYALPEDSLPQGKVGDNHIARLQQQLSPMTNGEVIISNLSATVVQLKDSDKPIARRQTSGSLILQLNGLIQAQHGCTKKCLMKNLNSFKQSLCSMSPSLHV